MAWKAVSLTLLALSSAARRPDADPAAAAEIGKIDVSVDGITKTFVVVMMVLSLDSDVQGLRCELGEVGRNWAVA